LAKGENVDVVTRGSVYQLLILWQKFSHHYRYMTNQKLYRCGC